MTELFRTRLSPQQLAVATHVDGPLLVTAGPGSGKTRVLTERIRHLLTAVPGHFRVLALTFTNKAAEEMKERLVDLGGDRDRAFIGTLHGFCLDVLSERGNLVGVDGPPHIFEQTKDRQGVLEKAIDDDPFLAQLLGGIEDARERSRQVSKWLASIAFVKSHPMTCAVIEDEVVQRVLDAYEAGMRACNAYDFDDLLLLTYKLLVENPKIGNIYRRLYRFICIDEAQDMNEAQYAVITALCADSHRDVMMVGDPRQSIYGFNTSGPEYMERFGEDFQAKRVGLNANYRSSQAVVEFARRLDSNYLVDQQLPVVGMVKVFSGADEANEASLIADELERLFRQGHPDVEGGVQPGKCAVLGRTRFALLEVESRLKERGVPFYKRLSASHENESAVIEEFILALRVLSNPRDRLHLSAIAKRWKVSERSPSYDVAALLSAMAADAGTAGAQAVASAIALIAKSLARIDLMPALSLLEDHGDSLDEADRLAIYQDVAVLRQEWDQFLRTSSGSKSLSSFIGSRALGSTQKSLIDGVALLTVHSSKGLEFDVVFVAGMAEGMFPDYRATGAKEEAEESRNAFVAVTRSKRLLYLSYPKTRVMPWGGVRAQQPSRFLRGAHH